uniref:(northern house mosquito) hypothetical protein n=1 Tax=Culex pipiens TaxID=7175 RepID=A0A8D8C4I4_CULPI
MEAVGRVMMRAVSGRTGRRVRVASNGVDHAVRTVGCDDRARERGRAERRSRRPRVEMAGMVMARRLEVGESDAAGSRSRAVSERASRTGICAFACRTSTGRCGSRS